MENQGTILILLHFENFYRLCSGTTAYFSILVEMAAVAGTGKAIANGLDFASKVRAGEADRMKTGLVVDEDSRYLL